MKFEQSLRMSASGYFQNSKNQHLIGIVGSHDIAVQVIRNAPVGARIWEVTTQRWGVMETSEMDDDGYVSIQFLRWGQPYIERVLYPVVVPLSVLENCIDVRQHRRAVLDHQKIENMPVQKPQIRSKSRFAHYVPSGGGNAYA